eukprot:Selendium_serpulae@DN6439_c2_g1_i10.p1
MKCKHGGLIIRRHNEVRDVLGDIASIAFGKQVVREPIIRPAGYPQGAITADLRVRGVFGFQKEALFDVRVTDTDAPSKLLKTPAQDLADQETEKKRHYKQALEHLNMDFIPFVVSVDGAMGVEAKTTIQTIARRLCIKWNSGYSKTVSWVKTRMSFAILRATHYCIRGSRIKWRSLGVVDGLGLEMGGT